MRGMVFAFTVPKAFEAIVVHRGVSWPMPTEAVAYKAAKENGEPGFWRLKERRS